MKMEAEIKQYHKRGLWTEEEDRALLEHIKVHGIGQWNRIPKLTGLKRCGKSCRLRWLNYLSPNVKRGGFSEEEDDLIIRLHKLLGNRWALIAGRVPGRTDNQVKNHWNTHLRKKLGITSTKKQPRKALFHNVIISKQKLVSTTNNNSSTSPSTNIISDHEPIDSHNTTIAMTPVEEAGGQNCNVIMGSAFENNIVVANDQGNPEEECARDEILGPESPLMMRDDRDLSDIILTSNPGNSIVEFLDGFCIPEHQMYWHYYF